MRQTRIIVLSVHYKYPELLRDQWKRIRECAGPLRKALDAELHYHPIVHGGSATEVVKAAYAIGEHDPANHCVHLRATPASSASAHGDSLAEALLELTRTSPLQEQDLIAVIDHDAHPVDVNLFAAAGEKLRAQESLAGIGIPQWHRDHCYLHPSFLMARAAVIGQMGPDVAFRVRMPQRDVSFWDVCEGFTVWCENNGRAILPLRVNSTRFPWSRWDSGKAPDGGAEFLGEHGERVRFGNVMHYGLNEERSLVSHVWAAPLTRHPKLSRLKAWLTNRAPGLADDYDEREVISAYLAEPLS
jgi:hypothetical protein